ncbi:MAG: metallophosphoesterase family protein [Lachnospiraceae bacterium]|nr:metallophosphoesterase family protein [Lachnospiraceae bacterium]
MKYFIADCHFFHDKLNTVMDRRGFANAEEMNAHMLEKWNARVRSTDDVFILGDLSVGNAEQTNALLKELKGKLYLIEGNHDRFSKNKKFDASRFEWIKPYAEMRDHKRKLILCHYPIVNYNRQYRLDDNGKPTTYMLYGHVHDTLDEQLIEEFQEMTRRSVKTLSDGSHVRIPCQMLNCFCMYSDYTPWTLNEWIAFWEERWNNTSLRE